MNTPNKVQYVTFAESDQTGNRVVRRADTKEVVAVHGKFCTGCSATSGVCRRLTNDARS